VGVLRQAGFAAGALQLQPDGTVRWTAAAAASDEPPLAAGSSGGSSGPGQQQQQQEETPLGGSAGGADDGQSMLAPSHTTSSSSSSPPIWPDSEVVCLAGCTALHLAAAGRQPGVVRWLLETAGVCAAAADGAGAAAVAVAAASGCVECCRLLLEAVRLAVRPDSQEDQLQYDGGLQCDDLLLRRDSRGRTALHMAARSGDAATWQYISGQMMLMWRAGGSSDSGVSVNNTKQGVATAPDASKTLSPDASKTLESWQWLEAAGAEAGGCTVLHFAAQGGNEGVMAHILGLVAGRKDGSTPQQQQAAAAATAADDGDGSAWLMARDDGGRLAWHLAAEQVRVELPGGLCWRGGEGELDTGHFVGRALCGF
jgi:ankyrin repeat protein